MLKVEIWKFLPSYTLMDIKIHCKYDALVNPLDLSPHPKNRNKHNDKQIKKLSELYRTHGVRHPAIVSNLSGFVVAGHGRRLAAIEAGLKEFPVVYQDFQDKKQEYAFIQSDNAIALWADLDFEAINLDLKELDLDLDDLAIDDFIIPEHNEQQPTEENQENPYSQKIATPVYEPKQSEPPPVLELYELEKYKTLVKDIKSKNLPKEIELFLINAASRHIVFNYENIAEFYCHQNKEVQELMEKSALVIIDFNKAIENGFVKLSKELDQIYDQQQEEKDE